jgi:hypothetical protein
VTRSWLPRLSQLALLFILLGLSAYLTLRPHLGNKEGAWEEGAITEVSHRGPVTVGHITWKLDSLQAYTVLVDDEKEPIDLDVPAGATIIVAKASLTPGEGLRIDDGFSCTTQLRDDRGNTWEPQNAFGFPLPTYCGDEDHPFPRNQTRQLAQVYVVPKSAVPHLLGISTEDREDLRRVLLTW